MLSPNSLESRNDVLVVANAAYRIDGNPSPERHCANSQPRCRSVLGSDAAFRPFGPYLSLPRISRQRRVNGGSIEMCRLSGQTRAQEP